jgi:hypothetical protein
VIERSEPRAPTIGKWAPVLSAISRRRSARALSAESVAGALLILGIGTLLWSRLMLLNQSLWGDEAGAVAFYIDRGPSAIWSSGKWIPNNHVLFDFLTWATTGILGVHSETTFRLWSVVPALAAAFLIGWWLWHRFDRFTAAVFVVLATAAPVYFDLSTQARGYGLAFLAAAAVVVEGDRFMRTVDRTALLLFSVGGFVGIATLVNFVGFFVAAAAVLMSVPRLRRQTLIAVACVGLASVAWYAPLLSKIIGYNNHYGVSLPWYGAAWAPLRDLFGAGVHDLAQAVPVHVGALVAAVVLAAGAIVLVRARDHGLVALVVIPTLVTYLLIQAATGYLPRFASFTFLPLIALGAIAIGTLLRRTSSRPRLSVIAAIALIGLSLVTLDGFVRFAAAYAKKPYEAANTAALLVKALPARRGPVEILTNHPATAFSYYAQPRQILPAGPGDLVHLLCTYPGPLIYVEQHVSPQPGMPCLISRDAFRIALPQRRTRVLVWLVPRLERTAH